MCSLVARGRVRLVALLAASVSLASAPDSLHLAPNVRDPVFAILVAYVRAHRFGRVTREEVAQVLTEHGRRSRLPWRTARDFARRPGGDNASAVLSFRFEGPVDVPIPYRILWYRPGRIRASATCRFREWRLAELPLEMPDKDRTKAPPPLREVHLYAFEEGTLAVDIDGWLDALLGGKLDDTRVEGLALARLRGREYGLAVGRNRDGKPRSGVFDLGKDSVVFPMSDELRAANRAVRREIARRLRTGPG